MIFLPAAAPSPPAKRAAPGAAQGFGRRCCPAVRITDDRDRASGGRIASGSDDPRQALEAQGQIRGGRFGRGAGGRTVRWWGRHGDGRRGDQLRFGRYRGGFHRDGHEGTLRLEGHQFFESLAVGAFGLSLVAQEDFEAFGLEHAVEFFAGRIREEAGFETSGAQDGLLSEGHAFDGDAFLGIGRAIKSDEVFAQAGEFLGRLGDEWSGHR